MNSRATHIQGEWPLVTASEMQALDRVSIDSLGVPGEVLMESAGRALVEPTLRLLGAKAQAGGRVVALCGAGNNGGDGFVAVRHLIAEGIAAEVLLLGDPDRLPADAAANWRRLELAGLRCRVFSPQDASIVWAEILDSAAVVIDALFGTGLSRAVEGGFARAIEALVDWRGTAGADHRILSVDIPSGLCADTGQVLGVAVEADETITISSPKIGLALEPGATHAGQITVARVGIQDPDPARLPRAELWNAMAAAARLPVRGHAGHKGSFGHVLVLAGSTGKTGAGALSARAAVRAGSGLVTLAYPIGLEAELAALPVEVMSAPVAATPSGSLSRGGEKAIEELVAARDVVALGPGIGQDAETAELIERLVERIDRPLVIDADGLNALVGRLECVRERQALTILTPHPGEAARLLDTTAAALNADRIGASRVLAESSGAVVVLKGARTVVADPSGRALVTPTGGPNLATGGTGDVLTGIIAALLASGVTPFDAAGLGAWWHGATADHLALRGRDFGLLASELADALPVVAAEIREGVSNRDKREEVFDGRLDLRFPGS